ncbi:MAG: hypothetical protein ACI4XH_08690, partial [Acutalibacteraceae bacterium]
MRKLKRILASFLVAVMSLTIMQIETFYIVSEAKYSSNDFYSASYSSDPGEYMVNIARAQKNRTGSSLGYNDQWCAYFISDCAEIAGQSDAIPPRAGVN